MGLPAAQRCVGDAAALLQGERNPIRLLKECVNRS